MYSTRRQCDREMKESRKLMHVSTIKADLVYREKLNLTVNDKNEVKEKTLHS